MSLRPSPQRLRIAALTFLCGLALTRACAPATPEATPAARASGVQVVSPAGPPEATSCRPAEFADEGWRARSAALESWKHRASGCPLELDYDALDAQLIGEAKVMPLASGRVLAAAGRTVYMLDHVGRGQAEWRHTEPQPIIDVEYVAATDLVYATAGDNQLLILDASTGRQLHRESRQGRGGFGRTLAYGKDLCLVADDNSGYRAAEDFTPPVSDGVTAWRGTKMLWHRELPPDAELRVDGERIFAVTKTGSRVLLTAIRPPADPR